MKMKDENNNKIINFHLINEVSNLVIFNLYYYALEFTIRSKLQWIINEILLLYRN